MLKALVAFLVISGCGYGTVAEAADEEKTVPYVGKVMMEMIVFFPREFDQLDEKTKSEITQALKNTGAQEGENGFRMPMKPLIGAWLRVGKQTIMTDTNGDFSLPLLPPDITEIAIYQQLSDRVPMAKIPIKRLAHKGEKVQPFVISIRTPFGECHAGKIESAR